jgi:preprotein translocase subunit SecG
MIVPGKDDNYPGGAWSSQGAASYMPHGIMAVALIFIILMLAMHLMKGGRKR